MNEELVNQLTAKIYAQIARMFSEECENHIDLGQIADNGNANEFMHVLGNLVPALIYTYLTNEKVDLLSFNHIMNRLVYQAKKDNQ